MTLAPGPAANDIEHGVLRGNAASPAAPLVLLGLPQFAGRTFRGADPRLPQARPRLGRSAQLPCASACRRVPALFADTVGLDLTLHALSVQRLHAVEFWRQVVLALDAASGLLG